jgi:hypothetical protein
MPFRCGSPSLQQDRGSQSAALLAWLAARTIARVVLAQHLQPGADIVGVTHGRRDAERCAAKGRVHLGDQLLEGVFLGPEGAGEIPVETCEWPVA